MKNQSIILRSSFVILLVGMMGIQDLDGQPDKSKPISQQVDSLLDRMTLGEKIGQMTLFTSDMTQTGPSMRDNYQRLIRQGRVGAVFNAYGSAYTRKLQKMAIEETRLGIPLLFGFDVIHGFRTIFPIPLAEAATWDPRLIQQASRIAAEEASSAGLHWTFAPMVDVTRDPRWGRIAESAGEDPYLGEIMAAARVRGFQGSDLSLDNTVLSCVKHFAAYGAAQGGRDYNTVNMSERRLREIYLPPFKSALDAGAKTIMTAFNEYNGVPATGNKFLFNQILREEWGFNGFVVTDYTAIPEMLAHGFAADSAEAARLALDANVDMDMQSGVYLDQLKGLVQQGSVKESQLDSAVARILRMKFQLGLFKDPYRYADTLRQQKTLMDKEHLDKAREVARESIVLLKNQDEVLPISKKVEDLAVIGPLADNRKELLGTWWGAGHWEDNVTILEGIRNKVSPETQIHYAKGSEIDGSSQQGFQEAVEAARQSDVVLLAVGESKQMSGEAASRATLDLPGIQPELVREIHKTGTPVVMLLVSGRPLDLSWADQNIQGILETWFLGTQTGHAVADVVFGDHNPSGKLPVTFPRQVGMIPYHYNHKNTGRPPSENKYTSKYIDVPNSPLYPFGYGLSYTQFSYKSLELEQDSIQTDDSISISTTVSNTGKRAGHEIVQVYIRDIHASVTRPIKELRRFDKIYLEAGESKKVSFTLHPDDLAFYNRKMKRTVQPGQFKLFIGGNSRDVKTAQFRVVE